ncbi:MAG: anti-sigma factor [Planctomycetota bacterium]
MSGGSSGHPESPDAPETNPSDTEAKRLIDLLSDYAAGQTLTDDETTEMNLLLADHPELADDRFERAAALLAVAELPPPEAVGALPPRLAERLEADAERFFAEAPPEPLKFSPDTAPAAAVSRRGRAAWRVFLAGAIAGGVAAAVLVSAVVQIEDPPAAVQPIAELPPDQRFADYQRDTLGVAEHPWAVREPGYEQVTGRVAWSDAAQAGYLVFEGLPVNDPAETQYQLWIVDPQRDELPVDGGVFDVAEHLAADGRAYVPIDAKLPVASPAAFAVTVEKPGGVVRSAGPLVLVAPVS